MNAVIFDLDGTLWDTCAACAEAWNNVLARNAIAYRTIRAADVRAVTGKPHAECIDTVFADLDAPQRRLISDQTMTEDNRVVGTRGGELYPGVPEGLRVLADRYALAIVSNCQAGYIETFLDCAGAHAQFADFECWGNTGNSKGENLAAVIRRNGFSAPVFVGDTAGDHEAANHCGVPFIQVTYGFGEHIEAVEQAESFAALRDKLLA